MAPIASIQRLWSSSLRAQALRAAMLVTLLMGAVAGPHLAIAQSSDDRASAGRASADIEWAQEVLKEKGFDPGRPDGRMNRRTRNALAAFQWKAGLPPTGELDDATILKLIEGRSVAPTMGVLGETRGSRALSGDRASEPAKAPAPRAAPTTPVEPVPSGSTTQQVIGEVRRGAPTGTPAVTAAPRTTIMVVGSDGKERPASSADETGPPTFQALPSWVHYGVFGAIAALLLFLGLLWWLSGRGQTPQRSSAYGSHPPRLEPRMRRPHTSSQD